MRLLSFKSLRRAQRFYCREIRQSWNRAFFRRCDGANGVRKIEEFIQLGRGQVIRCFAGLQELIKETAREGVASPGRIDDFDLIGRATA